MKGRLVEITKEGKDYGKFGRVLKMVKTGYFRVETTDGYRTVCHISEMNKVM